MTESTKTEAPPEERAPDDPTDLPMGSWGDALRRTVREFRDDNLTDWAAALTYYSILAIFPALLALVSVVGLLGDSTTQSLIDNLEAVAPGPAKDIVTSALQNLQRNQGAAGHSVRRRPGDGAVVGVGLRRRLHAGVQRHL